MPLRSTIRPIFATLVFAACMLAALAPEALATPAAPLQIRSTSVRQNGQQLVWKLQMVRPFSPRLLAPHRLRLCLVMHQGSRTTANHMLCIRGPLRHRRHPTLAYFPPSGRHHAITTMITRSSHSQLTASFMPALAGIRYRRLHWQVISTYRPRGCRVGGDCGQTLKSPRTLLRLHTPKLVGCVASGPRWVFGGSSRRHEIALTFDDGPWSSPPSTEFVNLLHRMHVPATFFEIGDQIAQYDPTGAIERRMLADGDMIGDHTWNHPAMTSLSPAAQRSELTMTAAAIRAHTGFTPCLFRAPYGAVNPTVVNTAHSLGFSTIQWDIDPRDWSLPGTPAIERTVIGHAHNGAIVLQHFGGGPRYETLAALPDEIRTLRSEGYRFVTVTQMLGYKLLYR